MNNYSASSAQSVTNKVDGRNVFPVEWIVNDFNAKKSKNADLNYNEYIQTLNEEQITAYYILLKHLALIWGAITRQYVLVDRASTQAPKTEKTPVIK